MIRKKELLERIEKLERGHIEVVYCEVCGCMLDKNKNAITGKPEVRKSTSGGYYVHYVECDYIYYPYYCRTHEPKNRRKT